MQQVIRALQGRRQRELQRTKIKEITPQQLFNNIRYHHQQISPHKILKHQYQHLQNYSYNDLQRLSERKLYPLSHIFAYQPLRINQIEEQKKRSKSISQANQFLRYYDPKKYDQQKNDFQLRWKLKKEGQNQLRGANQQVVDEKQQNVFSGMNQSVYSSQSSLHLPGKKSQLYVKFRAASLAAYFCVVVKRRLKRLIAKRKEKCNQYGKLYVQEACFSMQTYYYKLLQQEITQYILLLQKMNRYPSYNADQDILRILSFMLSKLSSSPIPKSLLASLEVIGINHTFFNFPFLFQSVAARVQFSEEQGCIVNVGKDESLMIGASLMGIVMLCFNLLYRPWLAEGLFRKVQKREFNIRQKYPRIKRTIQSMASLVYFLVIDNFIFAIEPFQRNYYQFSMFLKEKKIELVKNMPVAPKEEEQEQQEQQSANSEEQNGRQQSVRTRTSSTPNPIYRDKTNIIAGQNRQFYQKMKQLYPMEIEIISDHISQWVTKATLAALAEAEDARKQRVSNFIGRKKNKS